MCELSYCVQIIEDIVIPHFIYIQINYTSIKFNKAPASNRMTFIASDSLMPRAFMLSFFRSIEENIPGEEHYKFY